MAPRALTTGTRVRPPQPDFEDYELALRILSGAKLRPAEEDRAALPDAALQEASYRVQNCMASEIAAARACMLAMTPDALEAIGNLLQHEDPKIQLSAFRLWSERALPTAPVQVQHSIAPEDRQLAGAAARAFHTLTTQLVDKLKDYRTIDITQSKHVFRGLEARPLPGGVERPSDTELT